MTDDHWVLCVDDDDKLLSGLELQLGFDYEVKTATSGMAGLDLLAKHPDCSVIISDMRMPEMNGAQFLAKSRIITPDTTRLLLTGFSEVADTVSAVNDGGVFRFLTKPIPPDALLAAVEDGLRQWQLIRSERVLLEQTLHGAAQALIEALEIASPDAFSRSRKIESACRHVATEIGLEPVWEIALAGLLLRIGWIALPDEVVSNRLTGARPTADESTMLEEALQTTVRLVGRIPRLDGVADIIQQSVFDESVGGPSACATPAAVVRAVTDFDDALVLGLGVAKTLARMTPTHPESIVKALSTWEGADDQAVVREVALTRLVVGMIAERDIVTPSGNLLVKSGSDITETLVQRLRNFSRTHGVEEPITVSLPSR